MAEKKEEFVVSDRRRFAPEGELRTDVPPQEEAPAPAPPPQAAIPEAPAAAPEAATESEEYPEPPRPEGEQPRVDIIGARQTIDSLTLIQEKTKGNLTEREQTLLQNVLFELRMAWIEITNAIAKAPARPPGGGPLSGITK